MNLAPAPTLVSMDAGAVLAGPWQQVRVPWEGALARLGMFLLHSRTAFGLLLPALFPPRGRELVFSWQSRGCWEGKAEPASFLVELEAWGTGAVVLWWPIPPPTRTSDSLERESCQVTCRGQHEPEAPASTLTQEAGRVLSVWDWWTGRPPHGLGLGLHQLLPADG